MSAIRKGKTAAVVCNGEVSDIDWLRQELRKHDMVIAANGGSRHLGDAGVKPDCIMGDGDSLPEDYDRSIKRIAFPTEKDATDTELAVSYAFEQAHSMVVLYGAMGSREDHSFCNIMLLVKYGIRLMIRDRSTAVYCVRAGENLMITGKTGEIVSLQPVEAEARCTTTGLFYRLDHEKLQRGGKGVSNYLTSEEARISVESGVLIIFHIMNGRE